jgi:hypothetical protein
VVGGQSQSHLSTHFLSLSTTADFLGVFLLPAFGPLFRATGAPGAAASVFFGAVFGASSSSESRYAKMFLLRLA